MGVKIIIDSASDIKKSVAEARGLGFLSLKTMIGGKEYYDGVDITPEEFYEKLAKCDGIAKTSQVSVAEFSDAYAEAVANGDDVVAITISSKLSGTYQSATVAASDFEGRVYVVDSLSATIGIQVLIERAIVLRDEGKSAQEIFDELEALKRKLRLYVALDTLEYLVRGGRISKSAGFFGGVLNLKPVLTLENGALVTVGKARGAKHSYKMISDTAIGKGGVDFSMPITVAYSGNDKGILDEFLSISKDMWQGNQDNLLVSVLGSVIGTYAGPGAIVTAYIEKD